MIRKHKSKEDIRIEKIIYKYVTTHRDLPAIRELQIVTIPDTVIIYRHAVTPYCPWFKYEFNKTTRKYVYKHRCSEHEVHKIKEFARNLILLPPHVTHSPI